MINLAQFLREIDTLENNYVDSKTGLYKVTATAPVIMVNLIKEYNIIRHFKDTLRDTLRDTLKLDTITTRPNIVIKKEILYDILRDIQDSLKSTILRTKDNEGYKAIVYINNRIIVCTIK